jgi:hypothetical protein
MMDKKILGEVYSKLKSARETVAGGNVQDLNSTILKVREAIYFMAEKLAHLGFEDLGVVLGWNNKIILAKGLLERAKTYGDRLVPDRILCDVLNEMLAILEE